MFSLIEFVEFCKLYSSSFLRNQIDIASHRPVSQIRFMYEVNHVQASTFSYPILSPDAGGMKEQDLMCIKLHGVNRIGLKKIIDFIYTAKLSLNMENLQDTLEAASFLQILPVLDFCKVFLISGVRKHTTFLKSSPVVNLNLLVEKGTRQNVKDTLIDNSVCKHFIFI